MFLTIHTLAGALIARTTRRGPAALAAAGVASHLALDAVPHFGMDGVGLDSDRGRVVAIVDCTCALAAFVALMGARRARGRRIATTATVLGAALPDLLYIPQQLCGWARPRWFFRLHHRIQWSESPAGGAVEAVCGLVLVAALRPRVDSRR